MNFPRLFLVSLLALPPLLFSCKRAAPTEPVAVASADGRYQRVEDMPAALRAEMEAFGKKIESDLRQKTPLKNEELWDLTKMANLIMGNVQVSPESADKFRELVLKGASTGLERAYKAWEEKEVKFKGLVIQDGQPAVRLRIIGPGSGIMMTDLIVEKVGGEAGSLRVVDLYDHARDFSFANQMGEMMIPALIEEDKSMAGQVVSKNPAATEEFNKVTEMVTMTREKQFQKTLTLYHELSPAMQAKKMTLNLYISAANATGNAELYKKAVMDAAEKSQGGGYQIMLMGIYFGEKDYGKAIACVDILLQNFKQDAALLALKSSLLLNKGETPAAHALLIEALNLEADSVYIHTTGLDVLIAAKDNGRIRDSLTFLEKTGDYDFKEAVKTEAMWAEFKSSPESAAWR